MKRNESIKEVAVFRVKSCNAYRGTQNITCTCNMNVHIITTQFHTLCAMALTFQWSNDIGTHFKVLTSIEADTMVLINNPHNFYMSKQTR